MNRKPLAVCLILSWFATTWALAARPQIDSGKDIQQELNEARLLYERGMFGQAIARLQSVIQRMEQLNDLARRQRMLWDAQLHLGLAYIALNDPMAAKESFKQMIRLDSVRKLESDVYAPKVIALFEEARAEVRKEPYKSQSVRGPTRQPPSAKAGGSKLPYLLLGVGGAAAGGVLVATSRGTGGSEAATDATSTATTTTTTPSAFAYEIAFVGADPPQGSTISLSSRTTATFSFRVTASGSERTHVSVFLDDRTNQGCWTGTDSSALSQSADVSVVLTLDLTRLGTVCSLPRSFNLPYALRNAQQQDLAVHEIASFYTLTW